MLLDFAFVWNFKDSLVAGTIITLELSLFTIIFGTIIGTGLAVAKNHSGEYVRKAISIYTGSFRIMPILVALIWVFYALPIATGIKLGVFETGLLVLTLHLSADVAELVGSGIASLPKGQMESAKMLGFSDFQIIEKIVLPQVLRQNLSPLIGLYVEEIKNTTLVSIIALDELLHTGQVIISQTYKPLEIYTAVAFVFIAILTPLVLFARKHDFAAFMKKAEAETYA